MAADVAPAEPAGDEAFYDLTGEWVGDGWGRVTFMGRTGQYTDTYSGSPGHIELLGKTGPHSYTAKWGESPGRHGTMELMLAPDGRTIVGTWNPDPDCTIGGHVGGNLSLRRR